MLLSDVALVERHLRQLSDACDEAKDGVVANCG
jgi:hypothetical protein